MTRLEELQNLARELGCERRSWGKSRSSLSGEYWIHLEYGGTLCSSDGYGSWWVNHNFRGTTEVTRYTDEAGALEDALTVVYSRLM